MPKRFTKRAAGTFPPTLFFISNESAARRATEIFSVYFHSWNASSGSSKAIRNLWVMKRCFWVRLSVDWMEESCWARCGAWGELNSNLQVLLEGWWDHQPIDCVTWRWDLRFFILAVMMFGVNCRCFTLFLSLEAANTNKNQIEFMEKLREKFEWAWISVGLGKSEWEEKKNSRGSGGNWYDLEVVYDNLSIKLGDSWE
jgi:hypothetical protein